MKTFLLSVLVLVVLLSVSAVVSADGGVEGLECKFDDVMFYCGGIQVKSSQPWGSKPLREYKPKVINPVKKFARKIEADSTVTNSDAQLADAFIHYVCFEPDIEDCEEKKVFDCIQEVCPAIKDRVPDYCEGIPEAKCLA